MHKLFLIRTFSTLFFGIICLNSSAFAGGFQINMLNTKNTGMAGASTAFSFDASTSFNNPGAMSFVEYTQISLGTSIVIPSVSYLSPYTGNFNSEGSTFATLNIYGVGKLNEKITLGLSINSPYKMHLKWSDDWTGRYVTIESKLNTYYIQPTISFLLNEKLSVGVGPSIAFGNTFIKKDIAISSQQSDMGIEMTGKSTGIGFNIGIFYKHNDKFSAGLNFRSGVKMNINNGDAEISNIPSSLTSTYPSSTSFETNYSLPAVIAAGIATNLTKELLLCIDFNYTLWDSFDSLSYEFNDTPALSFGSGKFYKNAFAIRLGAQYTLNDMLTFRAGVALDKSPVQDEYVSPENPDADRFMFSLGGSIQLSEKISLDLAYMLQNIKEREASNPETNFGGNYKSLLNIAGITLNYRF